MRWIALPLALLAGSALAADTVTPSSSGRMFGYATSGGPWEFDIDPMGSLVKEELRVIEVSSADDDLDRAHTVCLAHQRMAGYPPGWERCFSVEDRWHAFERGMSDSAAKAVEEADKAFINGVAK